MDAQQQFRQALFDPEQPIPPSCTSWNGSDPAQRFAVYRNNVIVALVDALAATYDVTRQLVGDPFFRAMAAEYARRQPPASPVMAYYGAGFADFIAHFPPAAGLPYLADLARLEYQRVLAFHAADAAPVSPHHLQSLLADGNQLAKAHAQLHPSLAVLRSSYAIVSLWAAHQGMLPLSKVNPTQPECALILRHALEVEIRRLSQADACFIEQLQQGVTLGAALEQNPADGEAYDPSKVLALLINREALCALEH